MHIMFVCTGNVCRSPMGELLLSRYLEASTITVSSAGTRGMICREIDPLAGRLMTAVGIDSSASRTRTVRSAPADPATPTFSSAPQFSSAPGNSAGSRGTGDAAPRTTPTSER